MDYYSVHGRDISSFDTAETHRLPTVTASQMLDDLKSDLHVDIPTGIKDLDQALRGNIAADFQDGHRRGGVKRGQVTEIWGPPGTGKTALGIQLAVNAMYDGNSVVWIDCFQNVSFQRFENVINNFQAAQKAFRDDVRKIDASKLIHFPCLSLPHLMALLSRPKSKSIPADTSLIIISSMSALINAALPKSHDRSSGPRGSKTSLTPSVKRLHGLQSITASLQKLAAIRNCAVVILSQCATKMQPQQGPTLIPAVNATVWEQGLSTRLVLFRDWTWQKKQLASVFLAGLQKIDGTSTEHAVDHISAFKVEKAGVFSVPYEAKQSSMTSEDAGIRAKRKFGHTGLEVPDSDDDEDYGWADEDEADMPPPPSQWQGSEDIILGQEVGHSEDEEAEEGSQAKDDSAGEYDG